jgi:hypothetical protein
MSIIKVSFEVTDNYNRADFRNYIKFLMSMDTKFEVFIVSDDPAANYIDAVGEQMSIPAANRVVCADDDAKIDAINNNNIAIHLDNIESFVERVETETPSYGVLVNALYDKYEVKLRYIVKFQRAVENVLIDRGEENIQDF